MPKSMPMPPEENHVEHRKRSAARWPGHAVAEEEEQQDQADRDAARLDRVPGRGADLLVVERGLAGDLQLDAGELGLEIDQVLADGFQGVAVGRERIGLDLARIGEDQERPAALQAEVLELGPVRFLPQIGIGELGVGLLEDRVEVHRGLGRLLRANLVGLLLLHVVLDLVGDLVELVDVGGEKQAWLH
jgi:hypothetical protein